MQQSKQWQWEWREIDSKLAQEIGFVCGLDMETGIKGDAQVSVRASGQIRVPFVKVGRKVEEEAGCLVGGRGNA